MKRLLPIAAITLLGGACTPHLDGLCSTNAQCRAGETCSAEGICLASAAGQGPGGGDGTGTGDGGVTMALSPDGGFVPPSFDAVAVAAPASEVLSVTFDLQTNAGASLDHQQATPAAGAWKAHVSSGGQYEGPARLIATAVDKSSALHTTQSTVQIDGAPPAISTAWDGGAWAARDGGFVVDATVTDARSGVQSATLTVMPSASVSVPYPSQPIVNGVARFNVDANLAPANAVTHMPFALTATDRVGNQSIPDQTAQMVLNVDDEPPAFSAVGALGPLWSNGAVQIGASVSDGTGSGVASVTAVIDGQLVQGVAGAGVWTMSASLAGHAPFEGSLPFTVTATDNVTNQADAGGTFLFDNVPPSIASIAPITAPDYVDATGGAWYAAGAGSLTLQASIDAGTAGSPLDGGSVLATAGATGLSGAPDGGAWVFAVPRSIGAGAEGAQVIVVSAADLAGNVGAATATVQVDDVPPSLGAQLTSPTGWVNGDAGTVALSIACSDNGSGLDVVQLRGTDGGVIQPFSVGSACTTQLAVGGYTPDAGEGPVPFVVSARDHVLNAATQQVAVLIDDRAPSIQDIAGNTTWHSGAAANLSFNVTATITDNGSGVASAALDTQQGTGANGTWTFPATLPATPIETDSYSLTMTATDAVGNVSSQPVTFKVDNVAPSLTDPLIVTAADGNGYFAGPTVAPAGGAIVVTATITDGYLDPASVMAWSGPGSVSGSQQPGTNTWVFAIPRAWGLNVNGLLPVALVAKDLAGNGGRADINLPFDDTAAFNPTIPGDATWYSRTNLRNAIYTLDIPITFATLPASGIKSVTVHCANAPDAPGAFASNAWSVPLSTACATANSEGPVSFSVTAVSNVGAQTAGSTGQRNVDDVAPSVTPTISYPAADGGPLGYSHDGAHFNVHDTGVAVFHAYDCGAGVSSSTSAFNGDTVLAPVDTGTTVTCPSPLPPAHVYDITVQRAFTSYASQAAMDFQVVLGGTVDDLASSPHTASLSGTASVTRRLWQTGAITAGPLAKGPLLYTLAGTTLTALQPATGATAWTTAAMTRAQAIAVGGTSAAPVVYVVSRSGSLTVPAVLYGYNASTGAASGSTCPGAGTKVAGQAAVAVAADGSGVASNGGAGTTYCDPNTGTCTTAELGAIWQKTAAGCPWKTSTTNVQTLAIGAAGRIYSTNLDSSDSNSGDSDSVNLTPLGGSTTSVGGSDGSSTQLAVGTDASGEFLLADNLARWNYTASGMTNPWVATLSAPFLIGSVIYGTGVSQVALGGGTVTATGPSGRPLLLDAQGGLYTAYGVSLDGPQSPPIVPGSTVTDAILDASGTLYVSSNGQITATATRAGPASGWSQPFRDQCRSSNLEFACPW